MEPHAQSFSGAHGPRASCLVCGEPLLHYRAPADTREFLCSSPHCHLIARRRAELAPTVFARLVEIHRSHQREQRARAAAAARRLAERRDIEAKENIDIRDSLQARAALPAGLQPPVGLPTGLQRVEPLPQHRRDSYRAHLESILAEALSRPEASDTGSPVDPEDGAPPIPLAAQLCAQCGGGCCSQGGERAYLKPETIRRVLRTREDLGPEQLVALYLERLAPETIAGSCVNQTATGCSLPRELRSDVCNDFYCPSLRNWRSACAAGESPREALVIQRRFDHWTQFHSDAVNPVTGVYVVSATATRPLPWPAPRPD